MKQEILKLEWDSEFFNFNVGKINQSILSQNDLKSIAELMFLGNFKLAYYSSKHELNIENNTSLEIKFVDKKTTFVKKVNPKLKAHASIFTYNEKIPTDKLVKLAIQSGVYSRFNVDTKIGRDKFEELYRIWVTKSVEREIAKDVIVYVHDNETAGYLTIGEKNNRADLGMGSVDSQYRGMGFGRVLFENAEKRAFDLGYTQIQIVTQGNNIPACQLYESIGYTIESIDYFYHIWNNENDKV